MSKEKKLHYYHAHGSKSKTFCGLNHFEVLSTMYKEYIMSDDNACATCKRILEKEGQPETESILEPEQDENHFIDSKTGKHLIAMEGEGCAKCECEGHCSSIEHPSCMYIGRKDNKSVAFILDPEFHSTHEGRDTVFVNDYKSECGKDRVKCVYEQTYCPTTSCISVGRSDNKRGYWVYADDQEKEEEPFSDLNCNDCTHLSPTEAEQNEMAARGEGHVPHLCIKLNITRFHAGHHPRLPQPNVCKHYSKIKKTEPRSACGRTIEEFLRDAKDDMSNVEYEWGGLEWVSSISNKSELKSRLKNARLSRYRIVEPPPCPNWNGSTCTKPEKWEPVEGGKCGQ